MNIMITFFQLLVRHAHQCFDCETCTSTLQREPCWRCGLVAGSLCWSLSFRAGQGCEKGVLTGLATRHVG